MVLVIRGTNDIHDVLQMYVSCMFPCDADYYTPYLSRPQVGMVTAIDACRVLEVRTNGHNGS